ncbi:hypothetical protein D5086_004348 [Populus alba]|uniref:Uncharacterized protein n=1 Tax=Populus alba TaxID=43335 RepID=A0ACC4CQ73_POPAL
MSQAVHLVTKNLPGTPFHLHSHSPVRYLALFGCCENKRNLGFGLTGCLKRLFFSYRFVLCVPFAAQQSCLAYDVCESLKVCGRLYGENHNCDGRAGARNVHGVDEVNYDEVLVAGWCSAPCLTFERNDVGLVVHWCESL